MTCCTAAGSCGDVQAQIGSLPHSCRPALAHARTGSACIHACCRLRRVAQLPCCARDARAGGSMLHIAAAGKHSPQLQVSTLRNWGRSSAQARQAVHAPAPCAHAAPLLPLHPALDSMRMQMCPECESVARTATGGSVPFCHHRLCAAAAGLQLSHSCTSCDTAPRARTQHASHSTTPQAYQGLPAAPAATPRHTPVSCPPAFAWS